SMIRYLGEHGQCSDPSGPSYDPAGLPVVPGLVEVITPESSQPGERHEQLAAYVGEVAIVAWGGNPIDPAHQYSGARWIRTPTRRDSRASGAASTSRPTISPDASPAPASAVRPGRGRSSTSRALRDASRRPSHDQHERLAGLEREADEVGPLARHLLVVGAVA